MTPREARLYGLALWLVLLGAGLTALASPWGAATTPGTVVHGWATGVLDAGIGALAVGFCVRMLLPRWTGRRGPG